MTNSIAYDKIMKSHIKIMIKNPFFGIMASSLVLVETQKIDTAATNGKHLFYNPEWCGKLTDDEVEFTIAHELLHCIYDHSPRGRGRIHDYWNMAIDYFINYELVNNQFGKYYQKGIGKMPKGCLLDDKYKDMNEYEIYDSLIKEHPPIMITLDTHLDSEDGDDDGEGNGGSESTEGDEGKGKDGITRRKVKLQDLLDEVNDGTTKEELKDIPKKIKDMMIRAAQAAPPGSTPQRISKWINELVEPRLNWRDIIRDNIQSQVKSDSSFYTPHRRSSSMGIILPGPRPETTVDVTIAMDMSGSISDKQATDFISEIAGMCSQYRTFKLTLWQFDTNVAEESILEVTEHNRDEKLEHFERHACGGTDFGSNWDYMKQHHISPKLFIMFTDGECGFERCIPDYCNTIWVINSGNFEKFKAPFGRVVEYDETKD